MIKFGSWNIRGLNDPLKQVGVRKFINDNHLDFMGVVETKIRSENLASSVRNSVPANWDYVHNTGTAVVARILVTWNTLKVRAVCISSSMQHITCKIDHVSTLKSWYVTVIYGYNNANDRRQLWAELRQFYGSIDMEAWLLMGDFNVVRSPGEKFDPSTFDPIVAGEFNSCVEAIEVDDLAGKGLWFTWTSKCGGMGNRKSKLDRAMINSHWQDCFPNTESVFGAPGISDHSTILVTIRLSSSGKKPFKFFDFWMSNPQFKTLLLQAWSQRVRGQPMARLSLKLKCLKSSLRNLNKSCFSDLSKRVMEAKEELVRIQETFSQSTIDSATLRMGREALLKYIDLSKAEESFKRQKSRVQWLALGDQNTKFFHRKMAANTMRKNILSIGDGRGNRVEDPIEVKKLVIQFYKDLLGTGFNGRKAAGDIMLNLIQNKVPEDMKSCLITAVSNLEVKNAMFSIKGDKAPGPDGFNAGFFQQNWEVVGCDVINAVQSFFYTGVLLPGWNATAITLIPKTNCPDTMKEYRPIACCNVVYKCITKILAKRLQSVLPYIISPAQAAFVKGRSIADSIMIMQELVRSYHLNSGPARCAIKIDIMKAYDSVDWGFLKEVMIAMNFPYQFIDWIYTCISTASFLYLSMGYWRVISEAKGVLDKGTQYPLICFYWLWKGFSPF